ncbi:hypothetical protein D3C75_699770 [compost metagenome]
MERIILPLLKIQVRILLQLLQCHHGMAGQRIMGADKNMGLGRKQAVEHQIGVFEQPADYLAIEIVHVEDADFAFLVLHILDDLMGFGLPQGQLVLILPMLLHQLDEGVDGKGIMLGGHGKMLRRRFGVEIPALQQLRLLDHLPGVAEELRPFLGQHNPLVGPLKNSNAGLFLQLLDGAGQAGLGDEQPFSRFVHRAPGRYLQHVTQLLQCHGGVLSFGYAFFLTGEKKNRKEACSPAVPDTIRLRLGSLEGSHVFSGFLGNDAVVAGLHGVCSQVAADAYSGCAGFDPLSQVGEGYAACRHDVGLRQRTLDGLDHGRCEGVAREELHHVHAQLQSLLDFLDGHTTGHNRNAVPVAQHNGFGVQAGSDNKFGAGQNSGAGGFRIKHSTHADDGETGRVLGGAGILGGQSFDGTQGARNSHGDFNNLDAAFDGLLSHTYNIFSSIGAQNGYNALFGDLLKDF